MIFDAIDFAFRRVGTRRFAAFTIVALCLTNSSVAIAQDGTNETCAVSSALQSAGMTVAGDGSIYLVDTNGKTIGRFTPGAHGNVAPSAIFCPRKYPYAGGIRAIAVSRGLVYVAHDFAVEVLPGDENGVVAPSRLIGNFESNPAALGHDATGLFAGPTGGPVQLSAGSDGSIYVLNHYHGAGGDCAESILEFGPDLSGNVKATKTFLPDDPGPHAAEYTEGGRAGCPAPVSFTLDAKSRVYVADQEGNVVRTGPGGSKPSVRLARIRNNGTAGVASMPLALDGRGRLYAGSNASVHILTGATSGEVVDTPLSGSKTGITQVDAIATDDNGKIYVSNCSKHLASILVFAANASGNVAPLYELAGSQTSIGCFFAS